MLKELKLILESRRNRRKRSSVPLFFFLDKYRDADDLLIQIHKNIKNRRLLQEARKQHVISLVTALETYFRDTIIWLINKKKVNISNLVSKVDKKFNIAEIDIIHKERISSGELIATQFNFQNLKIIDELFSLVFQVNFFRMVKQYKFYYADKKTDFIQLDDDFYSDLENLLKLRHNFTHDINFKDRLNLNTVRNLSNNLIMFINFVDFLITNLLSEKKRRSG